MRMNAPRVPISVGRGNEVRQRGLNSVAQAEVVVSHLVREQDAHQREREGQAQQEIAGLDCHIQLTGKRGSASLELEQDGDVVGEAVLQARADHRGGEQASGAAAGCAASSDDAAVHDEDFDGMNEFRNAVGEEFLAWKLTNLRIVELTN